MSSVDTLFSSLGDVEHDYANLNTNANLQKILNRSDEKLIFTCKCTKLKNHTLYTSHDKRIIVLTDKAIYNFRPNDKQKDYRWRITMDNIGGLIVSKESCEVVIQVMTSKENYRFKIKSCLHAFVECCAKYFKLTTSFDLPLEITDEKDLGSYVQRGDSSNVTVVSPTASLTNVRASIAGQRLSVTAVHSGYGVPDHEGIWNSEKTELGGRQGWLSKRKGDKESWDAKYVVLTPDTLRYYTPKLKGSFLLKNCKAQARSTALATKSLVNSMSTMSLPICEATSTPSSPTQSKMSLDPVSSGAGSRGGTPRDPETSNKIFPFLVEIPGRKRPVEAAATSKQDLERWIDAFNKLDAPGKEKKHCLVDGWLWKKNPHDSSKDNWRKRYFLVSGGKCQYYEMVVKGVLDLAEGVSCSNTKVTRGTLKTPISDIPSETHFSYRFNVNDAGRYYPFAADSRKDMDDWIESVNTLSKERSRRGSEMKINPDFLSSLNEKAPEGTVTIVFTGVQGISDLWNHVDGAAMGDAIDLHDGILRRMLRKFRGYEVKTEGTTFMVAFWTTWEALCWCLAVQQALVAQTWPSELSEPGAKEIAGRIVEDSKALFNGMRVYMGMQVGQPRGKRAPTTGRMDYYGPSVNKSARVAHAANGGQILITDDVLNDIERAKKKMDGKNSRLFKGLPYKLKEKGHYSLKGIARPVNIYEVLPKTLHKRSSHFGHLHTMGKVDPKEVKKTTADKKMPPPAKQQQARRLSQSLDRRSSTDSPCVLSAVVTTVMSPDDGLVGKVSMPALSNVDEEPCVVTPKDQTRELEESKADTPGAAAD